MRVRRELSKENFSMFRNCTYCFRMKLKIKLYGGLAGIILGAVLFCAGADAVTVDAEDISARAYGESVLKELGAAKESIYVAMYSMYARSDKKDNPAFGLVEALIRAKDRGIYTRVYLDSNKGNDDAFVILDKAGVDVSFIKPSLKMHAKLIVIDGEVVIDGSANWTQNALLENVESAQILRGKEFARIKLAQFEELEKSIAGTSEPKKALLDKVRVRNIFLEDARLAPGMVTGSDGYSFDFYLLLLRQSKDTGSPVIRVDYAKSARRLGIKVETENSKYRQEIRRLAENLKDKYRLIDYTIDENSNLDVKLLDYDDALKQYSVPAAGYFNIPTAYWEYGLDRQLILREKFAYLASIYEGETARPRQWWRKSLKGLSEKYHIDEWTFDYGLRGLKKLDLLEVKHSRIKPGERDYEDREPNEYRLKELVAPQEKERLWKNLEKDFGVEAVGRARELAAMIDEGNNVQAAKDFIRLVKKYGEKDARAAAETVSRMGADNPLRNISYVVGVLKRMEREDGNLLP